jgi:hypothetical protein
VRPFAGPLLKELLIEFGVVDQHYCLIYQQADVTLLSYLEFVNQLSYSLSTYTLYKTKLYSK